MKKFMSKTVNAVFNIDTEFGVYKFFLFVGVFTYIGFKIFYTGS